MNQKSLDKGKGIKREIKFRAWDIEKGEMLTPDMSDWYINFECSDTIVFCNNMNFTEQEDYFKEIGKVELMQYTGLKDKNGKEIYEGDIVKNENNAIASVKFYPEHLAFVFVSSSPNPAVYLYKGTEDKTIEVIGNIYENPELLFNHPTHH